LHDDCRTHARSIALVRKWTSNLRVSRLIKLPTLLKFFLPGIFRGVSDDDIKDLLGLVSKPHDRRNDSH
jgi:hypothetical protein